MKTIYLITTNKDKFAIAKEKATPYLVSVKQKKMETPEIQSREVKEVAEFSAEYAANLLQMPVIVTDAGLSIKALKGFPGPFVKYTNQWFSASDYLQLMKGKKNRRVEWVEVISFCEPGKKPKSFASTSKGKLALKSSGSCPGSKRSRSSKDRHPEAAASRYVPVSSNPSE